MRWSTLASPLAERWALHLEFLRASLDREPDGPQAWRWQIKTRVLTYLLARYGTDRKIGVVTTHPYPDSPAIPPLQRTFIPPRPRELFTERLQRIAEANDLPPEEQSRFAEELNRRLALEPIRELAIGKSVIVLGLLLWLLLGIAIGTLVGRAGRPYDSAVCFEWMSAIAVWAIAIVVWLARLWCKMRRL